MCQKWTAFQLATCAYRLPPGIRVASHPRNHLRGAHSTSTDHMPQAHRAMSEWSPEHFPRCADDIGRETRQVVSYLLQEKRHQEQSYRRFLALRSNSKKYGRKRG
jgi:hypothetical protein